MSAPILVVESGSAGIADAVGELRAAGWTEVTRATVTDEESAAAVVLRALQGGALVVDAQASREVVDRLCDDLRRLGRLEHRLDADGALTAEQHALLVLLADGMTLGSAATRLHLSRRSADRRLAGAKAALGATSTSAAVTAYRRRLARVPPAPPGHARGS